MAFRNFASGVAMACALLICASALADREGEERAAHLAVRSTLRREIGALRTFITETKTQFLSLSESKVTGRGYVTRSGNWASDGFTYTVKVRRSDYRTRDVKVTMDGGPTYGDSPDWTEPPGGHEFIGHFTSPTHGKNYPAGNITFAGVLRVDVGELRIYDNRGNLIRNKKIEKHNGRFSTTERLGSGVYRAVLGLGRMADSDEVRFSVAYSSIPDWGWGGGGGQPGENRVVVTSPRENATVTTAQVEIQGTSTAKDVRVEIFSALGRRLHNSTIAVSNGRWSTRVSLANGKYHLKVQDFDGRDVDELWFTKAGNASENRVTITWPKNNATVASLRVDIQGASTERDVRVEVFNAGGKRVHNSSIAVNNGRWSMSINLPNGRYRIKAQSQSGRDVDEIWFNRTNSGSGGSDEDRVVITYPRNGANVSSQRVEVQGTSTETDVRVEAFSANGQRVHVSSLAVNNGRWSVGFHVPNGRYRIKVTSGSGKDVDEITITRSNANQPTPRGGG